MRGDVKTRTIFKPTNGSSVPDLKLHWDADRLMFSMVDTDRRWQVFEVKLDGTGLKKLIETPEKDLEFFDATYLPSGKLIAVSNIGYNGVPCVNGNDEVGNMCLYDPKDGSLRRLTFDQDANWAPTVMNNGRIMYTRWEYTDLTHYFSRIVMHMNPDGTENKALYVKVNADDDTEHGTPFSDNELKILWKNSADPEVQLILIMCYSGWRIGEVLKLTTNLEERYFQGGIKTKAGKDRVVPIHSAVYEFAKQKVLTQGGKLCVYTQQHHRNALFYPTLERFGIVGDPKHTPHDCRHTFSMLCEKYGVRENDRKRMLGHSFGGDVTNAVYGHRTLEELRTEIEKIKVPFVTNCD